MIVKRHNYTLKNTGSIEPVSVQCRRTKNQHRPSTSNTRGLTSAGAMLFKHHRRCPNLAPASDQTSPPGGYLENTTHRPNAGPMWASVYWHNIGPAPGRCIVFAGYCIMCEIEEYITACISRGPRSAMT